MASIELKSVQKSFANSAVIHGINVDIADGEFVVIVGPSGCGKSTLLRMVAGLETVSAGEIQIAGRNVNDLEPMDRDIAMVFQNYALYPHMSVFQNMAYGLKIAGLAKADIEKRVAKAAQMLQLQDLLKRKPRALSGGQRQRVAMGRAIVREPAAFLFDEPLSNLDAKLRAQMRLEIKALQQTLKITALYVTHDQVEAMTLADRIIVMNAGVAEQIGPPLEVYKNPQSAFAAGFMGSPPMNMLNAAECLKIKDLVPAAQQNALMKLSAVEQCLLGIRPEHLRLVPPAQSHLCAQVVALESLGAETLIHLQLAHDLALTVRAAAEVTGVEPGGTCAIAFDNTDLFVFDQHGWRVPIEG